MQVLLPVRRWLAKPRRQPNPYTCRLARRVEFAVLWLARKRPYWSASGHLCVGGAEVPSRVPAWFYRWAAGVQNKCPSLRILLSA